MSDEAPAPEAKPGKKKQNFFGKDGTQKFRPSAKMRAAILQVLGRKRLGYPPDYRGTAQEHEVNENTLKKFLYQYRKGQIDMGDPPDMAQKKELDLRVENERSLGLLQRYEHLLNTSFEKNLENAEAEMKDGKPINLETSAIPKILGQLDTVRSLRIKLEKGVMAVLEKLIAMQNAKELHDRTPGATFIQNNMSVTLPAPQDNNRNGGPATAASQVQRAEIELNGDAIEIHQILRNGSEKQVARRE